jgi:hypothetical protein
MNERASSRFSFEGEDTRPALPRWLVLLPPSLLFVASIVVAVAAIDAWGAAEPVEIPAWMTTFAGLLIALPGVATGIIGFYETRQRTRGDFGADQRGLASGALWLLTAALAELFVAARIGDPATYNPLRDEEGNPEMVPGAFLMFTIVGSFVFGALVAPSGYIYSQAIWPERPNRFRRRVNERDYMGEYFRGRGRFDRWDRRRFGRQR